MKLAVINFSGHVGKTTVARALAADGVRAEVRNQIEHVAHAQTEVDARNLEVVERGEDRRRSRHRRRARQPVAR